ncbi:RagB/SusD family nutrient uptake outer membrane protein [Tamlana sp. 2201CG12-4]|uniref:RagB/SusD family nutrient uptake outer membrane protein n=1 Tax=Tamlana sp. 2201CG12-4 TaxID=3112582 RepID=UPI002DBD7B66|nr:RagB/SusD family nutrient uptake outer membrane protein [Tamlana sp. 2201CG12-4]MEC3908647.1 RagB/SusD family nutrient uptake outer membrane protein [Tamlana sp. 2201CG12-4]
MKKYIYIIAITILFMGCNDFLEPEVESLVVPENVDDPELLVRGAFEHLRSSNNSWKIWTNTLTNLNNDEVIKSSFRLPLSGRLWNLATFDHRVDNADVKNVWVDLYGGVNASNHAILVSRNNENIALEAEARFIRGFYYWTLTTLYGGVPIVKSFEDDPFLQRSSIEDVLHFIEEDWEFAVENGPDIPVMAGRITKLTAAAMLAKLYLYMGGCQEHNIDSWAIPVGTKPESAKLVSFSNWEDPRTPAEYYTMAETYLSQVYGQYNLLNNYRDNFRKSGEKDARNSEWLFHIEASATVAESVPEAFNMAFGFHEESAWHFVPSYEMFGLYHANDTRIGNVGKRANNGSATEIIGSFEHVLDVQPNLFGGGAAYVYTKYRRDRAAGLHSRWVTSGMPLLRYADVILMYAEAKYLNGDELGARDLLAEVRGRASSVFEAVDSVVLGELTTEYFNTNFMQELMDERKRELCAEGHRRIDLMRTGMMPTAINALNDTHPTGAEWKGGGKTVRGMKENFANQAYTVWFPIPLEQVNLAGYIQNPGYPSE